ncbi:MAG: glycosyltransferase family 4 protein [Verrucomicrobia bacterium]|nr:glycosyltransferase family 4 protein [Verrucomicrobiota bacterium]
MLMRGNTGEARIQQNFTQASTGYGRKENIDPDNRKIKALRLQNRPRRPQSPEAVKRGGSPSGEYRIAVDLTPMLPGGENGGIKQAIIKLLQGLVRRHGEKFSFVFLVSELTRAEVAVFTRKSDQILSVTRGNLPTQLWWCQMWHKLVHYQLVARWLARREVDLLYTPFGFINFWHPAVPTVAMVADLLHLDYPWSLDPLQRAWRHTYFRKLRYQAAAVQAISDFTARRLREGYQFPENRIVRVYPPTPQWLASSSAAEPQAPYFLYPANFWRHKNHEVLLTAFQLYLRSAGHVPWRLVLTGAEGERGRALRQLATRLGVTHQVDFCGFVGPQEMASLFVHAGALVYPSLHEGFGMPLIEAMRARVPIVCGRVGAVPEIVSSAALYCDVRSPAQLADALAQISLDMQLRKQLVRAGEQRIKAFDFEHEIDRLADAFVTVASERSERGIGAWNKGCRLLLLDAGYYARSLVYHGLDFVGAARNG